MQPPNILLCLADDAGMHMGAYGCRWVDTPGFDRVARDGILFSNAYTCNAKCAPSRASILTGRNSWQLKEAANHHCYFPAEFKTFMEALRENGYRVGYTAKGWAPGAPGMVNGRLRELTGSCYDDRKQDPPTSGIHPTDYAANFADFLGDRPEGAPFCFWYGSREPHRPYEYLSGNRKAGKNTSEIDEVYTSWPDNKVVRNDLLDYAYEVEHLDRHTVRMLEMLTERGELDNTLVIVTSDNGMPFPRAKGQEYAYSNHLPLAIMWPRGIHSPGRRVEDYVSFIDFAPTVLELVGLDEGDAGMEPVQGQSLTDIFYSEKSGTVNPQRDHVLIGKERHDVGRPGDVGYPIRGIFRSGWLYLRNFEPDRWPAGNPETGYMNCDGSPTKTEVLNSRSDPDPCHYWQWSFGKRPAEELYRVCEDPECLENLAERPEHQDALKALRDHMERELREQGDPRMLGRGEVFDEYPTAGEELLGYYERFMAGEPLDAGWISPSDPEDIQDLE